MLNKVISNSAIKIVHTRHAPTIQTKTSLATAGV